MTFRSFSTSMIRLYSLRVTSTRFIGERATRRALGIGRGDCLRFATGVHSFKAGWRGTIVLQPTRRGKRLGVTFVDIQRSSHADAPRATPDTTALAWYADRCRQ